MNHEQIQAFLTVVSSRSLSAASELLYTSQSTISHRLSSLENELNTDLIIRGKGQRSIELTPAGEKFLSIAQRWDKLWNETLHLDELDNARVLNIGGVESICSYYLLPFFYNFSQKYQNILKLSIDISSSQMAYSMLESHDIDIGFVTIPLWHRNLFLTPILEEGFKLIVYDPEYKWPESIHPRNLDQKKELLQPWSPEYQQWHNYWWPEQESFHVYVNNSNRMQQLFLRESHCWSIVTDCVAEAYRATPGFRIIEIEDAPPKRSAYMVVHDQQTISKKSAIDQFRTELNQFTKKRVPR